MQAVKPTIINDIAIRDKIFFIRASSKGVSIIFINVRISKARAFYIMPGMMMQ